MAREAAQVLVSCPSHFDKNWRNRNVAPKLLGEPAVSGRLSPRLRVGSLGAHADGPQLVRAACAEEPAATDLIAERAVGIPMYLSRGIHDNCAERETFLNACFPTE